jgi:hypothetical protein
MRDFTEYLYIRAWHKLTGSLEYYIVAKQKQAALDNATLDAIYHDDSRWVTITEVTNAPMAAAVEAEVALMKQKRDKR